MSQGNVAYQTGHQLTEYPSTTPQKLLNMKDPTWDNLCVFGIVGGAPGTYAVQVGQWAMGAMIIDVTNGTAYTQTGTVSVPTWGVIS